jgi:peptidoglycan/LPS O-acetylase OafA/YrhL
MNGLLASPRVADVAGGRENNFNLLRFIAASMVILYHSRPGHADWIFRHTGGRESYGSVPVLLFFAISGFLVTQSFINSGSLKTFLAARALRIFPGLWAAIPFTIIASSFASPVPWGKYLTHPQTLRYWWHNSLLWDLQFNLPGAFLHVPMARNVNGSLWTLPAELRMYWVCAALGVLGLYTSRAALNSLLVAILLLVTSVKMEALPMVGMVNVAQWELAFLLGAAFWMNRNELRLNLPVALLLLASVGLVDDPEAARLWVVPAIGYAAICLALHPAVFFRPFTRLGDYSYGLYIYAFPLQQQMFFYFPKISWFARLAIAYPIILGVAIVSWHLIEKPALSLKKYFRTPKVNQPEAELSRNPRWAAEPARDAVA